MNQYSATYEQLEQLPNDDVAPAVMVGTVTDINDVVLANRQKRQRLRLHKAGLLTEEQVSEARVREIAIATEQLGAVAPPWAAALHNQMQQQAQQAAQQAQQAAQQAQQAAQQTQLLTQRITDLSRNVIKLHNRGIHDTGLVQMLPNAAGDFPADVNIWCPTRLAELSTTTPANLIALLEHYALVPLTPQQDAGNLSARRIGALKIHLGCIR